MVQKEMIAKAGHASSNGFQKNFPWVAHGSCHQEAFTGDFDRGLPPRDVENMYYLRIITVYLPMAR